MTGHFRRELFGGGNPRWGTGDSVDLDVPSGVEEMGRNPKDVVSDLDKSRDYVVIPSRQFIPSGVLLDEPFRQVPQELHTRH